jgi:isopenicillin-N epimerase
MKHLRELFLLEPDVHFLNHGSYGATPRPVFEAYQEWQLRLERQPVRFMRRELDGHLADARTALARFVKADPGDLVLIPNATFGVNVVARSLALTGVLGPGDEVLSSDQEYGACEKTWRFYAEHHGFGYRQIALPLPGLAPDELVELIWRELRPETRVIYLSHLTSATAQTLPIQALCRRAREAGILTVIDGAHAPGQLPLDLEALGADFYSGNCHKWLLAPKGAGFLHARPELQERIEPLVVSWGWRSEPGSSRGSSFLDNFAWLGTRDYSAYLTVPDALAFRAEHDWPAVQRDCHQLLSEALRGAAEITGLEGVYADDDAYRQLAVIPLPAGVDGEALQQRLYQEHRVEIPPTGLGERSFLRISVQGYNDRSDIEALLDALRALL